MARKKVKLGKKFYMYPGGQYVRERISEPRGCKSYRVKEVKPGRKVLLCIKGKKGPRGGRTKAVSLLRSLKAKPKDKQARKAVAKAKRLKKKLSRGKKKMRRG